MTLRKIGLRDGLLLCFVLTAFVSVLALAFDRLCTVMECPDHDFPLSVIAAMVLVIPFQRWFLDLWYRYTKSLFAIVVIVYLGLAIVLWARSAGR